MYKKYNNIRTVCSLGHKHPSKGEAMECINLHLLLRVKETGLKSIEYEKPYKLIVEGQLICTHKPDFTLNYNDRVEIVEYKGHPTPDFKLKMKLFVALYPHIKYNLKFQKDKKLSEKSKMKLILKQARKNK